MRRALARLGQDTSGRVFKGALVAAFNVELLRCSSTIYKAVRGSRDRLTFVANTVEILRESDVATLWAQFRMEAQHFRAEADDTLHCFARVLAAPPADLREQLQAKAGFVLKDVTPTEVRPYSHDEVIASLDDTYRQLRASCDATAPNT